jgi:hypothetical protein
MVRRLAVLVSAVVALALSPTGASPSYGVDDAPSPSADSSGGIAGVRSSMAGGNTVGDQLREARPRADGYRHIDTPRLIAQLKDLHANNYLFQVWGSPTDWEDLRDEFAPAARAAGIEVWVYVVPPTECWLPKGKCSYPYKMDYVAWSKAIAELSVSYPNVVGWAIDDFSAGGNPDTFDTDYMERITAAADALNPDLALYTTAYYDGATSDAFLAKYAPYIEGVFFPYVDTVSSPFWRTELTNQLDNVVQHVKAHGLDVHFMNYTGRQLGSAVDESPEDVAGIIDAVRPYVADGRVAGVISYATPTQLDDPHVSSQNKARSGVGRLSLSDFGTQTADHWASGSQKVAVVPRHRGRSTIDFYDYDQFGDEVPGARGYFSKQLLIDGDVVWSEDIVDDRMNAWEKHSVDVTEKVAGKTSVTVAFRLYERGTAYTPTDVGIDDVSARGLVVRDGGFESRTHWTLDSNAAHVKPRIDLWARNEPRRLFDAVAQQYAIMAGVEPSPISRPVARPPANNRAMYGDGRLSLSLDYWKRTQSGQCATASQEVTVTSGLPRYELGFWQYDQWWPTYPGYHVKKVLIDGSPVYEADVTDSPANTWINGYQLSGNIDVTDVVKDKKTVRLTLALCEGAGVVNYPVDVGFDDLTSVGLENASP